MTSIANTFASKAAVALVAAAMVFSAIAPAAQAQSTADLQKMINDLLAQVAALQAQAGQGGSSSAAGVCPFTWTRDLSAGSQGADVKALQQFLNADADTRVAATGVGSAGMETEYFGPATAAAVSKFQVKYRSEVLQGLVNPTGYFGPASRAKANTLCVAGTPSTPTTPGGDDEDDNGSVTLGGEADLDSVELEDADDTSIEEGDEEVEVGVIQVEFNNGDAEISRLDIKLAGGNPWDAFESFALVVDGDVVAEVDAARKADYLSSTNKTLRFSGLDIVAMEDEVLDITVVATVKSTVRNLASNDEWELSVQSIRFFDADGVASTESATSGGIVDTNEVAEFTIEAEGTNDEAKIKKNSANPKSTSLKVEDNTKKSSDYEVLVFNIEVDEESSDTELNMAYATITLGNLGGKTFANVVDSVKMRVDGKTVTGKVSAGDTSSDTAILYEFDFNGLELAADDTYEAAVIVAFKGQNAGSNYGNGVTVQASVNGAAPEWELESVQTGDNVLSGAQSSESHTLNSSDVTVSGYKWEVNNVGTIIDFIFTVEAEDGDFDVLSSSIASTTSGTATITAGVLSSIGGDATAISGGYTVEEGDTATFRIRYNVSGANGTNREVKITTVAGMNVPNDKQTSPTATVNVQ